MVRPEPTTVVLKLFGLKRKNKNQDDAGAGTPKAAPDDAATGAQELEFQSIPQPAEESGVVDAENPDTAPGTQKVPARPRKSAGTKRQPQKAKGKAKGKGRSTSANKAAKTGGSRKGTPKKSGRSSSSSKSSKKKR